MADGLNGQAAVYVSWITFNNALDGLAQGIPNKVDKSAFTGLSGGVQAQLMAGLKFLGLIDNDGVPQPGLAALAVKDEAARKAKLVTILKERYKAIFALDVEKMTTAQLDDAMKEHYSVSGDTREKAVRFFLSAVEYAGIPVSRFLQPKPNGSGGAPPVRKRRYSSRPKAAADAETGDDGSSTGEVPTGPSRTITLRSGGKLTLAASVDLFTLDRADRDFVFKLIDQLSEYTNNDKEGPQTP